MTLTREYDRLLWIGFIAAFFLAWTSFLPGCSVGREEARPEKKGPPAASAAAAKGEGTAKGVEEAGTSITLQSLLGEMSDLMETARLPRHPFRTVQFSSYDRRSVSPDREGWFSNADGFGREPIPGFAAVLRPPQGDGPGLYLLCDVSGPGAIVRGWSAGMGGILRVYLDGAGTPIFEGRGYDFLARRSRFFLSRAGLGIDCGDAFIQDDADYFPFPFAKRLRVTWEGKLGELHFYHLQVRLYDPGCPVVSFDSERDVKRRRKEIEKAASLLTGPLPAPAGEPLSLEGTVAPGASWAAPALPKGPAAVTALTLRLQAKDLERALRGCLLSLSFDGASLPQVEAPAGDFFGAGPGVNPFRSLPMSVDPGGTMTCRFVMPYAEKASLRLTNLTDEQIRVEGALTLSSWQWDGRSCYFHARWRVDHGLDLRGPVDLPFVLLRGAGRFVGVAVQIMNPTSIPTPSGSWWGEGDEKIFVDGAPFPVAFGTGSEDYFNYSWSRPDLFDHPYCGQPLDSGPGNAGYVSDYRWQILDAIPFNRFFAFYMELWHHHPYPGLSYARTAYLYARPGAIDDHRRLLAGDLVVSSIPSRRPEPIGGAANSFFVPFEEAKLAVKGPSTIKKGKAASSSWAVMNWEARAGASLTVKIAIPKEGRYGLNVVACHRPSGGAVRFLLDRKALKVRDLGGAAFGSPGKDVLSLKSRYVERRLSTAFEARTLSRGEHEVTIECMKPGRFGFDYLWIQRKGK